MGILKGLTILLTPRTSKKIYKSAEYNYVPLSDADKEFLKYYPEGDYFFDDELDKEI